MNIKFTDNSDEVIAAFDEAVLRALETCGLTAEEYAKKLVVVDTGLLRNSITHAIDGGEAAISEYEADRPKPGRKSKGSYSGTVPEEENGKRSVYIGTNVEYAPYVELGTGSHTEGGRPDKWVYKDDKGTHMTGGNKAKPFLKPAVAGHTQTYRNIIENELKNADIIER